VLRRTRLAFLVPAALLLCAGRAPGAGRPSVDQLIQRLKDPAAKVRVAAADDLGNMGPAARSAVPALTQALSDESQFVQISAARALGQIGPAAASAVPGLIGTLKERHTAVRETIGPGGDSGPDRSAHG
jgi:HEAT repeat protein